MITAPWTKFRNLCSYYIDCVKYSEKRQEYLFEEQLNETYIMPSLVANWHLKDQFDVTTYPEQRFARQGLLSAEDSDDIFLGYPLASFLSPRGVHCLCPILLFPVHVTTLGSGRTTGLHLEIDLRGIDINRDWLEFHVAQDLRLYFNRIIEKVSEERGIFAVEEALQFLSIHFKIAIDPNRMNYSIRPTDAEHGIINTALLFVGGKTKYTRSLIRELTQIKNEPDEVLESTALAYVFRDPVLVQEENKENERKIPAVLTAEPLNAQQFLAVEMGLNSPITKVTGPPGTGKSHMSVNLIANEILNGGSVLFTSKNHKAIHAVFDMCQKAKPALNFNLMEFCTVPGNEDAAEWSKMDDRLEQLQDMVTAYTREKNYAKSEQITSEYPHWASENLEEGLNRFRDAESFLKKYDELRLRVSRYERLLLQMDELLSSVPEVQRHSSEFVQVLEECQRALKEEPRLSLGNRLITCFFRLFQHTNKKIDIRLQLNELVPGIAPAYSNPKSLLYSVQHLLKILKFRKLIEAWKLSEIDVINQEASDCRYEEIKQTLKKAFSQISSSVTEAFVERCCQRVISVNTQNLFSSIKGMLKEERFTPLQFMISVDSGNHYQKLLTLFSEFYKCFPGWAVTLLSLKKASPCLPGVFSLVIIDEASQCDIPPIIPALFRAKRVAVIGDPAQFPPVITIKQHRNEQLRIKYGVSTPELNKFSFYESNAFSVIPRSSEQTIRLVEHFRCVDEIAMYFNSEFYQGEICPCVGNRENQGYEAYNLKPGMDWLDAQGGDDVEAQKALTYLKELKRTNFNGSVGVIAPLRNVAYRMKTLCFENKEDMPQGLTDERINTAYAFQGGQCDVILFLLGLNHNRTHGGTWYITGPENKYIYNVSVSRAKVCFLAVGDKEAAEKSGISWIQKLIPQAKKTVNIKVGPGEKIMQDALIKSGLSPVAQYPIFGRYLDLALVKEKIDIEIDGQAWHLDRNGCRKADDIHRDLLLEINGWRVLRFWHYEIVNNVEECVKVVWNEIQNIT